MGFLAKWRAACLTAYLVVGCGEREPVPFGLDRAGGSTPVVPEEEPPPPSASVRAWPDPSPSVEIDGATWDGGGSSIRATYARDLDGDDDVDALGLLASISGDVHLSLALRDGAAFATQPLEHTAPPAPGCLVDRVRFEALDPRMALATTIWTCDSENGRGQTALHLIVDVGNAPRILERFAFTGPPGDDLSFVAADRDGDGSVDLMLEAQVGDARATLGYRSLAAGLARDPDAPEASIAALADQARAAIRRAPETALAQAESALALYDALCTESERPRLSVGTTRGVGCGNSVGAARARAVLIAAHAHAGHILQALALETALRASGARLREAEHRLAQDALGALPALSPELHRSVEARPIGERVIRRSTLAFPDEEHVLVLSGEPRNVSLATGTTTPSFPIDTRIVDPSNQLVLHGIERRCDGTVLVVAPLGASVPELEGRTALLEPRPAPVGLPCPDLTPAGRADANGFVALGWAPQGVIVARMGELVVVPLDVTGALAGAASPIASDTPAPAPVLPGAATSDLSAYALATEHGILLLRRGPSPSVTLVRPAGYSHEGTALDVAVSPAVSRLAWLADGHLVWVEL